MRIQGRQVLLRDADLVELSRLQALTTLQDSIVIVPRHRLGSFQLYVHEVPSNLVVRAYELLRFLICRIQLHGPCTKFGLDEVKESIIADPNVTHSFLKTVLAAAVCAKVFDLLGVFLDTYRTMCLAPQQDFRCVLENMRCMPTYA